MSTITIITGNGTLAYIDVDGTGSSGDPYRLKSTNSAAVLAALQAIQSATEGTDAAGATQTTLASIDTKTPALGQAVAAASTPVVLPTAQITTLTPPAAITGFATASAQSTGNTSLASLDTKLGEVQAFPTANTLLDRLKQIYTAITGTLTVATHAVTQSGTWTVQPGNTANTTAWKVDGSAVTQPVSNAGMTTTSTNTASLVPSATLYNSTLTLSTSAAAIGSSQACQDLFVQSDPDNTVDIFVGNSASQPIQLVPGQSWPFQVANVNIVYAKSASGTPVLNWVARS